MVTSSVVRAARRAFVWLGVIFLLLASGNALAAFNNDGSWVPKLALDLQGGTQIILEPRLADGQTVSDEPLAQAVAIIRQRVDASGVAEAEVTTQGGQNIVVSIPGEPDQATLQRIRSSAKLEFRPVLVSAAATIPDPEAEPIAVPEDSGDWPTPENASDLAWVTPVGPGIKPELASAIDSPPTSTGPRMYFSKPSTLQATSGRFGSATFAPAVSRPRQTKF